MAQLSLVFAVWLVLPAFVILFSSETSWKRDAWLLEMSHLGLFSYLLYWIGYEHGRVFQNLKVSGRGVHAYTEFISAS